MMRRPFSPVSGASVTIPAGIRFDGQTILSYSGGTLSTRQAMAGGPASGSVVLQLTNLVSSSPSNNFNANGTNMALNDTITITLDSSGNGTFNALTYVASSPGAMSPTLTIISVSSGSISTPNTASYSITR